MTLFNEYQLWLRSLLVNKYGLFSSLIGPAAAHGFESIHSCSFGEANIGRLLGGGSPMGGGASDLVLSKCLARSLGEALERYGSSFYSMANQVIRNRTHSELSGMYDLVPPEHYNLYVDFQYLNSNFPFRPYTTDLRQDWLLADDLLDSKKVPLPISTAHFIADGETKIQSLNSNGTGGGSSVVDARIAAILEFVERDAFCFYWRNRFSGLKVDEGDLREFDEYNLVVEHLRSGGGSLHVIGLCTDLNIPVILCVYFGSGKRGDPLLALSSAAGTSWRSALSRALKEIVQTESYAAYIQEFHQSERETKISPSQIATFEDHIKFYREKSEVAKCKFLVEGDAVRWRDLDGGLEEDSPHLKLNWIVTQIGKAGYRPYTFDFTTRDLVELGFYVCRAYVPGLLQLEHSHPCRYIGGPRILTLGKKLGLCGSERTVSDLNHDPHPFS